MLDSDSAGLRQALDEGAGEIGEAAGSDLPETLPEVRAALPDTVDAMLAGGRANGDLSLDQLLDGTPLGEVLDSASTEAECGADD